MKTLVKLIAVLVLVAGVAVWVARSDEPLAADPERRAAASALPEGAGDPAWRLDPVWDDGKAELCAYEVEWPRYGAPREGSAMLILVKEPWAPDLDVKADRPRPDGFEVLKLNHVRDVRTGIYKYHQMASVYLDRRRGSLVKLATTSSEACGITTAEMVDGRLSTRSYFDGQGDRAQPWPGGLPEDGLPAALRELVRGEVPATVEVFPSLLAPKLPPLAPETFRVSRRPVGEVEVPAGRFEGVEVALASGGSAGEADGGGRELRYVFAADSPHRLLALDHSDGTSYRLARCERLAYWRLNRPGDEEWLPAGLR